MFFPYFDKYLILIHPVWARAAFFSIYPFQSVFCAILFWWHTVIRLNIHNLEFKAAMQVSRHLIFHNLVMSSYYLLHSTRGRSEYQCTNPSIITPQGATDTYIKTTNHSEIWDKVIVKCIDRILSRRRQNQFKMSHLQILALPNLVSAKFG